MTSRAAVLAFSAFSAFLALGAPVVRAQTDLAAAEKELDGMFVRPAGTTISEEQKAALRAFVERHANADLGRLGYAKGIDLYFRRETLAAADALDAFFTAHAAIANAEHATMAGRIYLVAVREESRKESPDGARLSRWAERMVALYPDFTMLARIAAMIAPALKDPAPFRLGIARGAVASNADDAAKDRLLLAVYGAEAGAAARGAHGPGDAVATAPPGALQPGAEALRAPAAAGAAAPEPKIEHVIGGGAFSLQALRGKVVVLDFFATGNPPCRTAIADLEELQKTLGERGTVVSITKLHGRGMRFAPGDKTPHGGKKVDGLDRAAELAVIDAFAKAFALDWPVVVTDDATVREGYGVTGWPTMVVVGKDGRIAGKVTGGGPDATAELQKLVAAALQ